ncbi:MAG: lysine--tRNA ligase [Candidatus Paceibacteria bacterium]
MSSHQEIMEERRKKRDALSTAGMNPYSATTATTHTIEAVQKDFSSLESSAETITISGRVMALRLHGALAFADIFDGTSRIQAMFTKEHLSEEPFTLFVDNIDAGDFIEVSGMAFVTKRETGAVLAKDWKILTKSLQAIPTEHFGIKDEDARYRKRYLDILLDEELREMFVKKAKFWEVTRSFMVEHGFLEVETPTLEVTTGGAEARPFKTYHNDYDMPVYMRICIGELWQKRLMAAGYPKTFEIGRAYRNEGSSPEHLQEFTNLEFYWAYADYRKGMTFVRDLYRTIAQEVFGTTKFEMRGHSFDLMDDWEEIDYAATIKEKTGINIHAASDEEMNIKLVELDVQYEGQNRERLMDTLWKYCRKSIAGPAFLVNHPTLVAPLAKTRPGTQTVEMFQPIIAGSEVGRGYSELNDPDDQRARFEVQKELLDAGDEEAMMADFEFVEMLEYGMPPTCGFGFGDRLFAFLAGKPLRETQMFPLMKPKVEVKDGEEIDSLEPGCCEA